MKPLMAVAIIAAFGLLAIGLRPVIDATPAFANDNDKVQKVVICSSVGKSCADIWGSRLMVRPG